MGDVPLVAGERLVPSVAGECDRDVASCLLGDEERREGRLVTQRFVVCGREPREGRGDVLLDRELLVHRSVLPCDGARVLALVVALVCEADRERAHRLRRLLGHQRDDDARVDAARQQRAERDVGDQPAANRCGDRRADALEPLPFVHARFGRLGAPVTLDALGRSLRDEDVAGSQLVDAADGGPIAGDVLQREIGVDRVEVDLSRDPGEPQERLQLGREGERPVGEPRPQQRLLAEPVPGEHEALAARVPQREREHPVHPLDEQRTALLVQVRQHGRVACAADLVVGELVSKRLEVVGLAVVDRDDVARLVRHRLVSRVEVDHLQPLVAEHAAPECVRRALVRPAVNERGAHGVHELGVRRSFRRIESGDAAHGGHTARAVRRRLVPCGAPVARRGVEPLLGSPGAAARRFCDRGARAAAGGG